MPGQPNYPYRVNLGAISTASTDTYFLGPSWEGNRGKRRAEVDILHLYRQLRSTGDGRLLNSHAAYFDYSLTDGKLKKLGVSREITQAVCDLPGTRARGGSWSRTGTILFGVTDSETNGTYRVSPAGGAPVLFPGSHEPTGQATNRRSWPVFLEDSRHFFFVQDDAIHLGSLDSQQTTRLVRTDTRFVYAPRGYLLFTSEGSFLAQRFDATELRVEGEPGMLDGRSRSGLRRTAIARETLEPSAPALSPCSPPVSEGFT